MVPFLLQTASLNATVLPILLYRGDLTAIVLPLLLHKVNLYLYYVASSAISKMGLAVRRSAG